MRALAGNAATPLSLRLRDTDGTIQRFDLAASPAAGAPRFTYLLPAANISLLAPSATDAAGTTPGLNLAAINRVELNGDGTAGNAARLEIDRIVALRTLVVPGEIVRYRLIAEIPEGTSPSLELFDELPVGMRFINDNMVRVAFVANGAGITSSADAGGVPALGGPAKAGLNYTGNETTVSALSLLPGSGNGLAIGTAGYDANVSTSRTANADVYNDGTDVYFKLGSVVNADNDADAEFVIVEFNALVENDNDATVGQWFHEPSRGDLAERFPISCQWLCLCHRRGNFGPE